MVTPSEWFSDRLELGCLVVLVQFAFCLVILVSSSYIIVAFKLLQVLTKEALLLVGR